MTNTTAHIINHTHWDREWFLTSVYTSQWIPGLIDKIESLVTDNPNFKYLFDGQTLVIEDLLKLAPEYEPRVRQLIAAGNLIIGPYYCQPDWQITGGESLVRNLLYGAQDMRRYGCQNSTGWLVDTFGHTSQTPQLHHLFGLDAVFVWRGVPLLEPYFEWQGANGQSLFTIDLFGGYRNLYGVTHVPEVAVKRLQAEATKLRPYYPTPDIPMFDGYDLEQSPEDPLRFYQQQPHLPPNIDIKESSPAEFVDAVSRQFLRLPVITGELNSGKYGATFPGTFSARTYLKVMNRDCEHALYRLAEPLAVLAHLKGRDYPAPQFETWGRMLLQNTVHDCICGVSIDQVHEKMEVSYRQIFDGAQQDIKQSLAAILRDFAPGSYAVSTNPFPATGWHQIDGKLVPVETYGIGVWPAGRPEAVETPNRAVETFEWRNEHYAATVSGDGTVRVGAATLGHLVVSEETGDTYSDEAGAWREVCRPAGPLVIAEQSARHSVIQFDGRLNRDEIKISATVRLTFDRSPLIRWQVDLDSRGVDFKVELVFETGCGGPVFAGMPFDVVERRVIDTDLLPQQPEAHLTPILLGQRELAPVKTFPFHDFVAASNGKTTAAVLAKGVYAYQADDAGTLSVTLRRAVEQLTRPNLNYRVGDAGPFFYVPDARCERTVRHELAAMVGSFTIDGLAFQQVNAAFQNPPLVVQVEGSGQQTDWQILQENLPLGSLHLSGGIILARFFNPTPSAAPLSQPYRQTDVFGHPFEVVSQVAAKTIVTVALDAAPSVPTQSGGGGSVSLLFGPAWRVGDNQGLPDPQVIVQYKAQAVEREEKLRQLEGRLKQATDADYHRLQHQYYISKRELYEVQLSVYLNEEKLARQNRLDVAALYEPDDELARLGFNLNQMRTKRRIYDYIVEAL